jgi:DNA helicase-2/ATP-dependent DNA helicase PcrA
MMFSETIFRNAVTNQLGKKLDDNQRDAVQADKIESLFLVAGPGSGKTTVLTLRVLKLIYVDGIDPAAILATTFTRKAAAELRSRILGWGDKLRHALGNEATPAQADWLKKLDINRIFTGTLDSIAEQALRDFRASGMTPPVVLDQFVAQALLFREGILGTQFWQKDALKGYLKDLCKDNRVSTRTVGSIVNDIRQRLVHDRVDRQLFRASQPAEVDDLFAAIEAYEQKLTDLQVLDFALLEQTLLDRLLDGSLQRFVESLRVVLVDEYQDTNFLQESIYFELAKAALANDGAVTVVGDDDQSLYRFRGATVDLFRDFTSRFEQCTGVAPRTIYLNRNYRSTPAIVTYCMKYVEHDAAYTPARVAGKPALIAGRIGSKPFPILAMFREDRDTLAKDLAAFVCDVVGQGRQINVGNQHIPVRVDPSDGSVGDIALLCSSPAEYSSTRKARLPLLLRQALLPSIYVFNPRGREFSEVDCVAQVGGLILECIDPGSAIQADLSSRGRLPSEVATVLNRWRSIANALISSHPRLKNVKNRHSLGDFVRAWQRRKPQQSGKWPDSVELMTLLYNLITWIPEMQEDAEGLVYLEAITRTITQSAHFSSFQAEIRNDTTFGSKSVAAVIQDILSPLAAGQIDIDEDLLGTLPRDRLNILSIHQAKGLEFPLVIVDVGSDFKTNNHMQRFKRHPKTHGRPHELENTLRPHSALGSPARSALDRAFDDLLRQYFVAFSRPQDVLLLVGLCDPKTGNPRITIPNMAVGWDRYDPASSGCRWPVVPDIITL